MIEYDILDPMGKIGLSPVVVDKLIEPTPELVSVEAWYRTWYDHHTGKTSVSRCSAFSQACVLPHNWVGAV